MTRIFTKLNLDEVKRLRDRIAATPSNLFAMACAERENGQSWQARILCYYAAFLLMTGGMAAELAPLFMADLLYRGTGRTLDLALAKVLLIKMLVLRWLNECATLAGEPPLPALPRKWRDFYNEPEIINRAFRQWLRKGSARMPVPAEISALARDIAARRSRGHGRRLFLQWMAQRGKAVSFNDGKGGDCHKEGNTHGARK